ncbi:hypothetical protein JW998_05825 [candidate division KSB1 bacterium]|nr:hypothetical protein [candidate division KSB1 bacterium]
MAKTSFTSGKYIAYLSFALQSQRAIVDKLPPSERERFEQVHDLYLYLSRDGAEPLEIPPDRCAEASFLEGNEAFFIRHLLIDGAKNASHEPLVRHLNDCYGCFQIYSQFFKEYSLAYQEISLMCRG